MKNNDLSFLKEDSDALYVHIEDNSDVKEYIVDTVIDNLDFDDCFDLFFQFFDSNSTEYQNLFDMIENP